MIQRDDQSLKAQRIYFDFFSANPSHPQSQRFVEDWKAECEARGKPLDWRPDEDTPQQLPNGANGGAEALDDDEIRITDDM